MANKKLLLKLSFILGVFLIVISYFKVPFIFFQQDEWLMFGRALTSNWWQFTFPKAPIGESIHFIPLGNFIKYLFFSLFQFNFVLYNLTGLLIHLLNAFLIYQLGLQIFKKKFTACLASILFLSSSTAAEIVMWPVASLNMLSLSLALLAWILVYPKYQTVNRWWLGVISVGSVVIIEYSLGLLLFIPLVVLTKSKKIASGIKTLTPFLIANFIYLAIRAYLTLTTNNTASPTNHLSSNIGPQILVLPLKYLGQLTNFELLFNLFQINLRLSVGKQAVGLGIFLIIVTFIIWRFSKQKKLATNLLICLLFILTSALPFIFVIPSGGYSLLSGRYLYFGTAAFSLFLAGLMELVINGRLILKSVVICLVIIFLTLGFYGNFQKENQLAADGEVRQAILKTIVQQRPSLPQKVVFYTESDQSFYGLPEDELIMPFQSGFGQTLLVWLQNREHFPSEFFQNKFLWEIKDQGYQEIDSRGFGYFRDFKTLTKNLVRYNLPASSVIAFRYDSASQTTTDITDEVQGRIAGFLADKNQLSTSDWTVTSSTNQAEIANVFDGQKSTIWDSKLPYKIPQWVEVDLGSPKTIAQVSLDTYNDRNQNQVGFKVLLSNDQKNWQTVFLSKRYPPDMGLINLYFKPQLAQFVRIDQIGYHCCADWMIGELNIYE